jgi:hypothetical protein
LRSRGKLQGRAQARGLRDLRADDYRTVAPEYVRPAPRCNSGDPGLATRARLVGLHHQPLTSSPRQRAKSVALEPIVVENPGRGHDGGPERQVLRRATSTPIRAVAEFSIPSIVEDTGDLVVSKFLVASRPSAPQVVACQELVPPPVPADVRFTWDWDTDKLFVSWCLPREPAARHQALPGVPPPQHLRTSRSSS